MSTIENVTQPRIDGGIAAGCNAPTSETGRGLCTDPGCDTPAGLRWYTRGAPTGSPVGSLPGCLHYRATLLSGHNWSDP